VVWVRENKSHHRWWVVVVELEENRVDGKGEDLLFLASWGQRLSLAASHAALVRQ